MRLFSTEQVSKYHPDKYADQISDAILDACLKVDPDCRVACETLVKGKRVVLAGEITVSQRIPYYAIARRVAAKLGYEVVDFDNYIQYQSPEIAAGVRYGKDLKAGDQGMMYGYACRETMSMLPFGFDLANRIIAAIEGDVEHNSGTPLKGDAKCQVTVDLDAPPGMGSVKTILVSACSKSGLELAYIEHYIHEILWAMGIDTKKVNTIINPAGMWTIGGPEADCGLTGRKIVCDQYGGYCPVGGGAFSGKDPSKVDRSGAYMARKIACDVVDHFDISECSFQLAYAIGRAEPVSVSIDGDLAEGFRGEVTKWVTTHYDLTPAGIIKELDLLRPQYEELAEGCHYRFFNSKGE